MPSPQIYEPTVEFRQRQILRAAALREALAGNVVAIPRNRLLDEQPPADALIEGAGGDQERTAQQTITDTLQADLLTAANRTTTLRRQTRAEALAHLSHVLEDVPRRDTQLESLILLPDSVGGRRT